MTKVAPSSTQQFAILSRDIEEKGDLMVSAWNRDTEETYQTVASRKYIYLAIRHIEAVTALHAAGFHESATALYRVCIEAAARAAWSVGRTCGLKRTLS